MCQADTRFDCSFAATVSASEFPTLAGTVSGFFFAAVLTLFEPAPGRHLKATRRSKVDGIQNRITMEIQQRKSENKIK